MEVRIEVLREEHFNEIKEIYNESISKGESTFQREVPTFKEWDEGHLKEERFVAIIENKIVGFVGLSPVSTRWVYRGVGEVCIYIREGYKGKGIGKNLLNYLVNHSEENGFWTLNSNIFEDNKASIKLHESCGFRIVGTKEALGKNFHGKWVNVTLMERRSMRIY